MGRTIGLRASAARRPWRNSVCPVIQRINMHTSVPISTPCQETKFTSPPFIRCWEGTPPAHGGFGPSGPGTDPPVGTQWLSLGPKAKQKGLRRLPPSQGSSRLRESGSPLSPLSTRRSFLSQAHFLFTGVGGPAPLRNEISTGRHGDASPNCRVLICDVSSQSRCLLGGWSRPTHGQRH